VKNPRVDQKPLGRYRKIMAAAFNLADPRHLLLRVEVPADLTAEMLDDKILRNDFRSGEPPLRPARAAC
jgi:hypothetical protein